MDSSWLFFLSVFRAVRADKNDFLFSFLYCCMLRFWIKENKSTTTEKHWGSKSVQFWWTSSKIWFSHGYKFDLIKCDSWCSGRKSIWSKNKQTHTHINAHNLARIRCNNCLDKKRKKHFWPWEVGFTQIAKSVHSEVKELLLMKPKT